MPYSLRTCTATSFLDAEHVRKTRGAHIWTHQRVVDLIERPLDYDYNAMIPAYRERPTGDIQSLKVDRVIGDGEVIHWRGHEAVVARNACTVEDGYGYAGKYLHGIAPDLILGGHSWAIVDPRPLINRCIEAAVELREAFVDLTNNRDYRLAYDPYWVRVHPYRVRVTRGGTAEAAIVAKNFMDVPTVYEIKLACPKGMHSRSVGGRAACGGRQTDVSQDGVRCGQLFDCIVNRAES